jgi:hypothetical protein
MIRKVRDKAVLVAVVALLLGLVSTVRPVEAFGSTASQSAIHAYAAATAPSGYGVQIDSGSALSVTRGCQAVSTGTTSAMAVVQLNVLGGPKASTVSIGSDKFAVAANTSLSAAEWVTLNSNGDFATCLPAGLAQASIALMAQTTTPTSSQPGGLVAATARIPLVTTATTTSGSTSGSWAAPADATPTSFQGLILQVSSQNAGAVQITGGSETVDVDLGPTVPATTLWLPAGSVTWTTSSAAVPEAVMLGFVTSPTDATTAGALINPLPTPLKITGTKITVAGKDGIPTSGAQIPATSVLASITGADPAVVDPLAEGREVPTAAVTGQKSQTVFRLAHDNSLHFSAKATVDVVAWLGGDIVHAANSVDLTQPGSPQPSAATATTLTFPGVLSFTAGEALVIGPTSVTPTGLVALVDSVSNDGTNTTVTYHPGGLLDGFTVIGLVAQLPAKGPNSLKPLESNQRSMSAAVTVGLDWSASTSITLGTNPSVTGEVSLDFAPSVTVSVNINTGWWGLPTSLSIHYAVDVGSSATASLSASGSWSGSKTFTLLDRSLGAIDFGWFVVVPELDVSATFSASASASASISGTISEHIHDGFTTTASGNGVSTVGDSNNGIGRPSTSTTGLETSVSASADAALTAELTLAIDGIAGPDASATLEVALNVNPGASPAWSITVSGDFTLGVNLDALNIPLLSWALALLGVPSHPTWTLGHLGPYVVASGAGPTGGQTGGSGGPGGGSTGPASGSGNPGGGGGNSPPTFTQAPPGASVTVSEGPAATYGYRYAITLTGFDPNSAVGIECYDSQDPNGYYGFYLVTNSSGDATTSSYCYSASGPYYWVVAGGLESNQVAWNTSGGTTPPSTAGESIQIGWSTTHSTWIYMSVDGFPAGTYTYTCNFASGGDASFQVSLSGYAETLDNGETCNDSIPNDTVWVTIGSVVSNSVTVGGGSPPSTGPQSIQVGWSTTHPTWITMDLSGFAPGTYTYTCDFASGGDASYQVSVTSDPESIDNGETCFDAEAGDQVWVTIGSVSSNKITVGPVTPPSGAITIGWGSNPAPAGNWMDITFTNFPTGSVSWYCVEEGTAYGPYSTTLTSSPETLTTNTCYDTETGGSDYVTAEGITSNTIATYSPPPPPGSITIGWGSNPAPAGNWMDITFTNFPTGSVSWYCVEEGTAYGPYSTTLTSSTETLTSNTCYDTQNGGSDYVTADGIDSNTIPTDYSPPPPPQQSISIGWGSNPAPYGRWMNITFTSFPTGSVSWYCVEEGVRYGPYSTTLTSSTETLTSNTCYDTEPGGSDYVTSDGINSNTIGTD